jgi:hypothetical protein
MYQLKHIKYKSFEVTDRDVDFEEFELKILSIVINV